MENKFEHLTENRHFEMRIKIENRINEMFKEAELLQNRSSEQSSVWESWQAQIFENVFSIITDEYPSFWKDAEENFEGAVELVKEKITEEENKLKEA